MLLQCNTYNFSILDMKNMNYLITPRSLNNQIKLIVSKARNRLIPVSFHKLYFTHFIARASY